MPQAPEVQLVQNPTYNLQENLLFLLVPPLTPFISLEQDSDLCSHDKPVGHGAARRRRPSQPATNTGPQCAIRPHPLGNPPLFPQLPQESPSSCLLCPSFPSRSLHHQQRKQSKAQVQSCDFLEKIIPTGFPTTRKAKPGSVSLAPRALRKRYSTFPPTFSSLCSSPSQIQGGGGSCFVVVVVFKALIKAWDCLSDVHCWSPPPLEGKLSKGKHSVCFVSCRTQCPAEYLTHNRSPIDTCWLTHPEITRQLPLKPKPILSIMYYYI